MFDDFPDGVQYAVVINHEEQYSIWPAERQPPSGWKTIPEPEVRGFSHQGSPVGSKADVTKYIEEVWTDMRPLSIHKEMAKKIMFET